MGGGEVGAGGVGNQVLPKIWTEESHLRLCCWTQHARSTEIPPPTFGEAAGEKNLLKILQSLPTEDSFLLWLVEISIPRIHTYFLPMQLPLGFVIELFLVSYRVSPHSLFNCAVSLTSPSPLVNSHISFLKPFLHWERFCFFMFLFKKRKKGKHLVCLEIK